MHASSHKLALALTDRLGHVAPRRISFAAADGEVSVYFDGDRIGGSGAAVVLDRNDRPLTELLETAALSTLGDVQDLVMRHLQLQWPIDGHGRLALPGARTDGSSLHLWYGDSEHAPAVALKPIELGEIMDGALE